MKKLILTLLVLFAPALLFAQTAINPPKDLTPTTAHSVRSERFTGQTDGKITYYYYQWKDENGNVIKPYGGRQDGVQRMPCYDWDANPSLSNDACVGPGDPQACCTGPQTGTCDDRMKNADCVGDGDPLQCCKGPGVGICECWQETKSTLIELDGKLKQQLEIWEGVTFAP